MMKYLDTMLEWLRDSKWHDLKEIKDKVSLPDDKFNELLYFLEEQSFISKYDEKIKITPLGLKFLGLPI